MVVGFGHCWYFGQCCCVVVSCVRAGAGLGWVVLLVGSFSVMGLGAFCGFCVFGIGCFVLLLWVDCVFLGVVVVACCVLCCVVLPVDTGVVGLVFLVCRVVVVVLLKLLVAGWCVYRNCVRVVRLQSWFGGFGVGFWAGVG